MFRLAKVPDTGDPAFFLLCDHFACMEARRANADTANHDEYVRAKRAFLKMAIDEGWWIDLEGVWCPFHAREMVHASKEARERASQIVQPQGAQIAAFGRSA